MSKVLRAPRTGLSERSFDNRRRLSVISAESSMLWRRRSAHSQQSIAVPLRGYPGDAPVDLTEVPQELPVQGADRQASFRERLLEYCCPRMLMKFSCCSIRRSKSGIEAAAVNTNCSACRTSSMEVAPPSARICVSRSESLREARV